MQTINRNLFIVKPKQPFIDWINTMVDWNETVHLDQFCRDCTTYLIPEFLNEGEARRYIQSYKTHLFAIELNTWEADPKNWPKKRTPAMFDRWFDLEFHSMINDLDEGPFYRED